MVSLDSAACKAAARRLSPYERTSLISESAGLLTLPQLSSNAVRCEVLVHLAVAYATGTQKTNRTLFKDTLNDILGNSYVAMQEDPQEDVFISNVLTEHGDLKVFNGLWEANDYFIQTLIDLVSSYKMPKILEQARDSCIALLKISNEVVNRSSLERNSWEESIDKIELIIPPNSVLKSLAKRVIFTEGDFESLGVAVESLAPFILPEDKIYLLKSSNVGDSLLERMPILRVGKDYVLALPNAVGVAVRMMFLNTCKDAGEIRAFSSVLAKYQVEQLRRDVLREFKGEYKSFEPGFAISKKTPPMSALFLKNNTGDYLQVIVIHDDLEKIVESGLSSYQKLSTESIEALDELFENTAKQCQAMESFNSGVTILTHGGLGRGYLVGLNKFPDNWLFVGLGLYDLILLCNSKSEPIHEIIQCLQQKSWLLDQGIEFQNINGDFNYYGYWKTHEFKCIPDEVSISDKGMVSLATDFVFPTRRDLRIASDKHSVYYFDGRWIKVERLTKDSLYQGMKLKPIYVSFEHIENCILNGLVKSDLINIWFGVLYPDDAPSRVNFEWWSSFINTLEEAISWTCQTAKINTDFSVQIEVDFSNLLDKSSLDVGSELNRGISVERKGDLFKITPEPNFLANFSQADNSGERIVLKAILSAVNEFLTCNKVNVSYFLDAALEHVLGNVGVRLIHVFRTHDMTEYLLAQNAEQPLLVNKALGVFNTIQISHTLNLSGRKVEGVSDCISILNGIVDQIWLEIKSILNSVERKSLIYESLKLLNSIEQDKQQWIRTAKAVKAIYSKYDNIYQVAQERDSHRSLTSLCLRAVLEMAVCECPEKSQVIANKKLMERLLSLCSLLVNTASDSDAIHWGLVTPELTFYNNGTYSIPTNIGEDIVFPYLFGHFHSQFESAIDAYGELYETNEVEKSKPRKGAFGDKFDEALIAEYGFSADQLIECWAELIDLLLELESPIYQLPVIELVNRISARREVSEQVAVNFLDAFSLKPRAGWSHMQNGYSFRDIAPWKYKRRLSCLVKPIIQINENEVVLSMFLIKLGISYFLERAKNGEFNTEFFKSPQMRSYVGSMVDERGAEFTDSVAIIFESNGWTVKKELLMGTLGAPTNLGDIDIFAFKDRAVVLIECKNLQMAKTVSEIADVCNRFKGKEKDELRKHLNRVDWVSQNLQKTLKAVGWQGNVGILRHALLTSAEMPMKYRSDLPIDSADVISFKSLSKWLEDLDTVQTSQVSQSSQ